MHGATFKLFALKDSAALGASVATHLGAPIAAHEEREFEDREHKARPLETVAGADVYVIHSLHPSPDQVPTTNFAGSCFS